ncbi:unnamed protein product [Musa textilis]
MVFNNEVFDSPETSLSHDELLESFQNLYDELKKISKKYSLLKTDYISLANEFDALKNNYDNYISTSCTSCAKCKDLELSSLELKNKLITKLLELHALKNKKNDLLAMNKKLELCLKESFDGNDVIESLKKNMLLQQTLEKFKIENMSLNMILTK